MPPSLFDDFMPTSNLGSMFMSECTQYEVSKIISELKNGKSSDIPISVIKKTSDIISLFLAIHFNYLMSIGKFPDELELEKITPIYKKRQCRASRKQQTCIYTSDFWKDL